MENIAVQVHQGNKVLNGKLHLQKIFFFKSKYDINKQD